MRTDAFSVWLKQQRLDHGLTLERLAQEISDRGYAVSVNKLWRVEKGQFKRLDYALRVNLETFFGEGQSNADPAEAGPPTEGDVRFAQIDERLDHMMSYRRKRDRIQYCMSLGGGVLAACLVLILSSPLRSASDAVMTELTTTINAQRNILREVLPTLGWVTKELADRDMAAAAPGLAAEKAQPADEMTQKATEKYVLAGQRFELAAALEETDGAVRMDRLYEAAMAYEEACEFKKATTLLDGSVREDGGVVYGRTAISYRLGMLFHRLKEYGKAASQYEAALEPAQGSPERQHVERLQEKAAFNLGMVHASFYAERQEARHLRDTIAALEKSVDLGGSERLAIIQNLQSGPKMYVDVPCPEQPWIDDLRPVSEEPAFTQFLKEQSEAQSK